MSRFAVTRILPFAAVALAATPSLTGSAFGIPLQSLPAGHKAIEPSCFTTAYPVSSTCHAGVHTLPSSTPGAEKRDSIDTLSRVPNNLKAIAPSCSTIYSSTTSCYAGVHPQPTLSEVEVTITSSADSTLATMTTTTQPGLSVGTASPTSSSSGGYTFIISPDLRSDIIELANSFCPAARIKREALPGPSCRLPSSARTVFIQEVQALAAEHGVVGAGVMTGGVFVFGALMYSQLSNGLSISPGYLISEDSAEIMQELSSTSSSSFQPPPTLQPGPPNQSPLGPDIADVAVLTEYWEDYFSSHQPQVTVTASPSFVCTHGAAPHVFTGTAGYCVCGDGKTYPVSPMPQTTVIDGTRTTYNIDCPYTAIPSTTTNLGPTVAPTKPPSSPTAVLSSASCLPGGAAFKRDDMKSAVQDFCKTASKQKWTAGAGASEPTAFPVNLFNSGSATKRYSVDSDPEGEDLSLQVRFTTAACEVGEPTQADFRNFKWCKNAFGDLINQCEVEDSKWQRSGRMLAGCVEWWVISS